MTLFLGVGLSVAGFMLAQKVEADRSTANLQNKAGEYLNALQLQTDQLLQATMVVKAFFDSSRPISQTEFKTFAKEILHSTSGLQALEWVPKITAPQKDRFIKKLQSQGFPFYEISEMGPDNKLRAVEEKNTYFPITFIEPLKGKEKALGFDVSSNGIRLVALRKARDTGKTVLSRGVQLIQTSPRKSGFLLFQPVYDNPAPPNQLSEKRKKLRGFVLGAFRIDDLVEASLKRATPAGINFTIFNQEDKNKLQKLFFHRSRTYKTETAPPSSEDTQTLCDKCVYLLHIADQKWRLVFQATPLFMKKNKTIQPWVILGIGLFATLLLLGSVLGLVRKEKSLNKANNQLAKDILERKRLAEEEALLADVANLINTKKDRRSLLRAFLERLQYWSGCEAAGIRLKKGEDFPYFETRGFSKDFIKLENSLCNRDEKGKILKNSRNEPLLDCMCGNILQARIDPDKHFFTNGGSFWSNCTTDLLNTTTGQDRLPRTRNRCNGAGYESVALVPLRSGNNTFGLIQLNDKRKGRFSKKNIRLIERLANNIASALAKFQAEEETKRLFKQWQLALKAANMGWWHYDPQTKISTWDERYADLFQVSGHESPSEEILKRIHTEDLPKVWAKVEAALSPDNPKPFSTEYRINLPDGSIRWIEAHGLAQFRGQGKNKHAEDLVGTVADITERKQYMETLARSEERYRLLAENTLDVFWTMNLEMEFTFVNKAVLDVTGYTPDEWIGSKFPDYLENNEFAKISQLISDEMARGEKGGGLIFETIMLHKSGEPIFVEVHGKLIFDQKAKPVSLQGAMRDISERKSYEFARQKSEEQFRAAFESAPEGMALLDQDQQFVKVNPRLCEMLGYSAHEFQGLNFNQLTHPENRQTDRSTWLELLNGESSIKRNELKIIHKNGEAIWGIVSNAAVNDENGRLEYVISHIYDITERKKADNAKQEAILRQREAVQASNVGLWDWNLLTNRVAYSSEWKSQIGYQDHEIGDDFEEWESRIHPDDLKPTLNQIQKSLEQANPRQWVEFRFRHKDGSYRWILAQASIFRDESGKPVRMLGSHVDITDRKHTEQALRLSEEKFAAAFRHSPVWVAITTLEKGEYIDVNDTFLKATGYSREEVIGHTALDLEIRKDPAERERIVELIKKQGSVKNIDVKRRLRSGEIRDMLLSAELLPVPGEEVIVVVLADITELKKSQKEKDDLESQLRQAQKMEAIGTLAGGIAHDFNNILTAIFGFGELLQVEMGEESQNRGYVDQILTAADRGQNLVKQILAFSRKVETEKKPLNLNHCVEEAVLLLKQTIPKMIFIELHLKKGLNLIEADPGQLEQIVMNLATNAKDAMPHGGKLVFETDNVVLSEDYCREHLESTPGEYVRLQVSDTGQGIGKELLDQVFDPFFTTKDVGKGTGLGLSTVYGIVKAHNGFIYCYSEPGMGTNFRIYLPVLKKDDAISPPSRALEKEELKGGSETLLYVDDEESLRQLGSRSLSKMGYKVITASNGEEALKIYQKQIKDIDLVILDVSMPGMGGHKCLQELLKINPKAKVLIASGYTVNGQLKNILADGAAGYIAKPFEMIKMLKLIRSTLDDK